MINSKDIEKILYMGVGRSGLENEASIIAQALSELMEYQAIGTVEEFKALKDKSEPKKAKWEFDDFTAQFGNPYRCSNCNEEFGDTYNYCPNCGCDMYADCLAMKGE